jgi:hypothetical protein
VISGVPWCKGELANINLLQAADLLTEEIRSVQQKAMTEGTSLYTLQFYDHYSYYLLKKGPLQIEQIWLPHGVQVYTTNFKDGQMLFYSSGRVGIQGGRIVLEGQAAGRRINVVVVPITGRVRINPTGN